MIELQNGSKLAPQTKEYFMVVNTIVFAVLLAALFLGTVISSVATWSLPDPVWFLIAVFSTALLGYLMMFFFPTRKYETTRWRFDDQGLHLVRGIWWRTQNAVPRSRVQHIDVSQGPLQRKYNIAQLVLHTAGTINASVSLVGLEYDQAVAIRNELLEQDESDAV